MAEPGQPTGPGDSTPNFDWLRDHDGPGADPWRAPGAQDSALDMLPPEEQPAATPFGAGPALPEPLPEPPAAETSEEPEPTAVWTPPVEPASVPSAPFTPPDAGSGVAAPIPSMPAARTPVLGAPASGDSRTRETAATSERDRLLWIGLISYASAATLALIYLFFAMNNPQSQQLESLPDVPPLEVSKGETMKLVPVAAPMPAGHTLHLGESQRYGNIRVEPLRVTREPLSFAHFSGRAGMTKPASSPVLKLWVKFTNVSADQTIAPLDAGLLFVRTLRDSGEMRANQFVCRESEKTDEGAQVLVYDHPPTSEWDLVGQQLGKPLQPGEAVEMYIPTEEAGLEQLTGELVWRLHFRKGYSPSGNGVTTVVEIDFNSAEIQNVSG